MKKHLTHHPSAHASRHPVSRTLPGEGRSFLHEVMVPGALTGLLGGALMALLYMGLSAAFGQGFWTLPKLIAGMFWRDLPSLAMPWEAVLVGLFVHFNVAIALGVTWALVMPRVPEARRVSLPLGLLFAFALYVVMNWLVAPHLSPPMRREIMPVPWVLAHAAFGFTLALMVSFRESRWVMQHRLRELPVRA